MNKEKYLNEARDKMEKINSSGIEIHTLVNNVICGEWDCDLQCQLIKDKFLDEEAINKEANYQADRVTFWATTDPVYKHYKREEIKHKGDKESKGGEKMKPKKTFIIETPDKKIKITEEELLLDSQI